MSADFTVATPSFTSHLSPFSHFERSLPSKSTIASDGGSVSVFPGVTTFGSGQTMPLLYSRWSARQVEMLASPMTAATPATINKRFAPMSSLHGGEKEHPIELSNDEEANATGNHKAQLARIATLVCRSMHVRFQSGSIMIHVVATISLQPGTRDMFLEVFRRLTPLVQAEDGC